MSCEGCLVAFLLTPCDPRVTCCPLYCLAGRQFDAMIQQGQRHVSAGSAASSALLIGCLQLVMWAGFASMGAGWVVVCWVCQEEGHLCCCERPWRASRWCRLSLHRRVCWGSGMLSERLAVVCAVANMPGDSEHHYTLRAAAQVVINMPDASVTWPLWHRRSPWLSALVLRAVGQLRLDVGVSAMVISGYSPLARGAQLVKLLGRLWLRCSYVL